MHDETGVIQSTGPEMRRFFFGVDEAAALIRTAIDHIDDIHGKVLSREMKAAQIQDLLTVWTKHKGGRWERAEAGKSLNRRTATPPKAALPQLL